jgi:ssDNA thymidine ADP-ribosyltransferase, DarT
MDRDEVKELHFITSIDNLGSIMMRGILSHNRAARLTHTSVALESVQDIRRGKSVPNGGSLHSYANLYFDARNPMMFLVQDNPGLIVLRISPRVLDIPDTVVADGNAATWNTRFHPSPDGLAAINAEFVFARYWTDPDYMKYLEKKRARNAEVLVPNLVPLEYIEGCYVGSQENRRACMEFENLPVVDVRREIFFK